MSGTAAIERPHQHQTQKRIQPCTETLEGKAEALGVAVVSESIDVCFVRSVLFVSSVSGKVFVKYVKCFGAGDDSDAEMAVEEMSELKGFNMPLQLGSPSCHAGQDMTRLGPNNVLIISQHD